MALRDQPYLPLYIQDFMTDEKLTECSASATGVYIRIMCLMHKSEHYGKILLKQKYKQNVEQTTKQSTEQSTEQTFKQSSKHISNFACQLAKHLPYDYLTIMKALEELLTENVIYLDGDTLVQKRMVKDNEISEIRSKSGKKGGAKSIENRINFAQAKVQAKTQAKVQANTEYENENYISSLTNTEIKDFIDFDLFWNAYDKKVGDKEKLRKKWQSLKFDEQQKAMAHIPKYKEAQPDKKFRKDPQTYLNNKSFNDEIIFSQPQQAETPTAEPVKKFADHNAKYAHLNKTPSELALMYVTGQLDEYE